MKHNATQYGLAMSAASWGAPQKFNPRRSKKRTARGHVPMARRRSINMDMLTDEMSDWLLTKLGMKPTVKDITEG